MRTPVFNLKTSLLLSRKKKNTNEGLFSKIKVAAVLIYVPLVRTLLDASNSGPLFAFNDGEIGIALTSRR